MRVLFFSIHDWANVGQTFARALKKVGVNAKAFCMFPEVYKYADREECYTSFDRLKEVVTSADLIVLMHSHPDHVKLPFNLSGKRVAVFHGGTEYRQKPEMMNAVFNPLVYASLVQTGDLLDKGAKNEKWVLTGIDTERIRPRKIQSNTPTKKIVISHYPRSPQVKGTVFIENAMSRLKRKCSSKFVYYTSDAKVPWKKNLDRVAKCDVYIEAMQPTLGNKPYGEWGVQALEAAALGKVVVTHFLSRDRYEKDFGIECPFVTVNNEKELYEKLLDLINRPQEEIKQLGKDTRKWVETHHSLKALGTRLKEALEIEDES